MFEVTVFMEKIGLYKKLDDAIYVLVKTVKDAIRDGNGNKMALEQATWVHDLDSPLPIGFYKCVDKAHEIGGILNEQGDLIVRPDPKSHMPNKNEAVCYVCKRIHDISTYGRVFVTIDNKTVCRDHAGVEKALAKEIHKEYQNNWEEIRNK
jgi:hypothetical protein